jgi:protocatechuate 3,4-dioxygenase, alpha subunit
MTRTPSQTVGPYFAIGLTRQDQQVLDGDGVELAGVVYDGQGEPIPDAVVEVYDAASRAWGRCGTDGSGRYHFVVPRDARRLEAFVFARGLLRHQLTRIYLDGASEAEDETLVAAPDGTGLRFDIHMQGENATLFFEH